jgi:hypothetical protein
MLKGNVGYVIGGLRITLTKRKLKLTQDRTLKKEPLAKVFHIYASLWINFCPLSDFSSFWNSLSFFDLCGDTISPL